MQTKNVETYPEMTDTSKTNQCPSLCMIIPCYNEEAVLKQTAIVLTHKLKDLISQHRIDPNSAIMFIDDGSSDETWNIIEQLHHTDSVRYKGVKFSHNSGHQNAVFAGLIESMNRGYDASISMDADLQDDPNAIPEMIEDFISGSEIVYGVRNNRDNDTIFKRFTAESFYKLMTWMGIDIIPDHADFRLMSHKSIKALSEYSEENLFLRGIVPSLGFPSKKVYYKRGIRTAGESKYPLSKMLSFALEGITSFSVKPLRIIAVTGLVSIIVSILMLGYTIVSVASGHAVSGWGSMMFSLWLLGGLNLTALGIVGEYIGRIYIESKHRPRYIVETKF